MREKLKKFIKPVITIAVIAVIAFFGVNALQKKAAEAAAAMVQAPRTVTLKRGDLANVVSVNGVVMSRDSTNVYSTVAAQIKAVHIEVGDVVEQGALLVELDSSDLERSLARDMATLSSSEAGAELSLELAKKDLDNYIRDLNDETNTAMINAETSVKNAELQLENAMTRTVRARMKLQDLKDEGFDREDAEYKTAEDAYDDARAAVEQANVSLEAAKKSYYAILENNNTSAANSIEAYEDRIRSAELSSDFTAQYISIQKTQQDIANCRITAPVSGIVTAVYAVEGAMGNNMICVIQDADNLKIVANIKEYDIGVVAIGDPVTIKADALTDIEFEGMLSKIAPTSTAAASGGMSTLDAEYESEISVIDDKKGLLIGMNTKLSIITEERRDIYSVPYESVGQNEAGDTVIYTMETSVDEATGEETTSVRELVVTIGMENDLFSEISAPELTDGLVIYRDSDQGYAAYIGSQSPGEGGGQGGPGGGRVAARVGG